MKRISIESVENAIEHYLYDLSLPQPERREKKQVFRSGMAAANWLGVPPNAVQKHREPGQRIWSPRFQKWYAVRSKTSTKIITK